MLTLGRVFLAVADRPRGELVLHRVHRDARLKNASRTSRRCCCTPRARFAGVPLNLSVVDNVLCARRGKRPSPRRRRTANSRPEPNGRKRRRRRRGSIRRPPGRGGEIPRRHPVPTRRSPARTFARLTYVGAGTSSSTATGRDVEARAGSPGRVGRGGRRRAAAALAGRAAVSAAAEPGAVGGGEGGVVRRRRRALRRWGRRRRRGEARAAAALPPFSPPFCLPPRRGVAARRPTPCPPSAGTQLTTRMKVRGALTLSADAPLAGPRRDRSDVACRVRGGVRELRRGEVRGAAAAAASSSRGARVVSRPRRRRPARMTPHRPRCVGLERREVRVALDVGPVVAPRYAIAVGRVRAGVPAARPRASRFPASTGASR